MKFQHPHLSKIRPGRSNAIEIVGNYMIYDNTVLGQPNALASALRPGDSVEANHKRCAAISTKLNDCQLDSINICSAPLCLI